MRYILLLQQ